MFQKENWWFKDFNADKCFNEPLKRLNKVYGKDIVGGGFGLTKQLI